jgi:K+-transporting ATPase KdpF subunit
MIDAIGEPNVGHNFPTWDRRVLCAGGGLRMGVRKPMTPWEVALGLVMAIGLTVYLVYAMLRPEKF